jgi:hypothetical protein
MQLKYLAIVVGLIASGGPALAVDASKPAAPNAVQTVAVKKPVAKKSRVAARRTKEDSDPLAEVPSFSATAVGWQLIEDPKTGARLGVPEKLVPHAGFSRSGSRWASAQGQIQIETFRLTEAALPALFDEEKKASRRQITSSTLKPDTFVILGVQGLKNFLVRADARGGEVRGVTVLYDQATEGIMGRVAIAVANSFVGFPDPNAAPPAGVRRLVEYGSAIVVSSDGDLIATAHGTDECQAITVPPFGHAERVAADTGNDLALLRVYGARNLAPVVLADDGSSGGDLTLVGVADPLAQGGDGGVTRAAARIGAQGVEPSPKLGFSGAAAIDARGRLAGMVDLRPPVVAGMVDLKPSIIAGGAANQAAALVPIEAIRAFLQAQRIAPAASGSTAAPDQSVVRVICVRK